jgi:glycyl-tRNA synthetase beta chain
VPELLVELVSEEVPARMQARGAGELERLVCEGLRAAGLAFAEARAYAAPRRLVLVVEGLPERQPDLTEERKGPREGAPQKALDGFLRAAGLTGVERAELRDTGKGRFYFAVTHRPGRPTGEVVAEVLTTALHRLSWPKSMRWGEGRFRWVRPLHRAVVLLDGRVIETPMLLGEQDLGAGDMAGRPASALPVSNRTLGHRFLAPGEIEVTGFADYVSKLKAAKVVLDAAERRRIIREGAQALAAAEDLRVRADHDLLEEVAGLVEWPVVLMGRIDRAFMDLPPEVLTTAMRAHQKYFAVEDREGRLAARFIVVSNMETADGGATIVAGNERVLRARLADARFFWNQDRKRTLSDRAPALRSVVFHARLGTLDDKADRIQALAADLAANVPGCDKDRARSAARLAKADLTTGMVGEFPELQGIMGRYYALGDGEHAEVAVAIGEHYAPQGPGDRCPTAPVSVAVALADKIDTLVGFWLIGETPTGSKDPYALRRAALGVIRLVLENGLRLPLASVFTRACALYRRELLQEGPFGSAEALAGDLLAFFAERLKVHLRGREVRHDLIAAAFAVSGEDDLVRLLARVEALAAFLTGDDGANLLTAYRRAANIVRIEEKRDRRSYTEPPDQALLREPEEGTLAEALGAASAQAADAIAREDFTAAMAAMARLRAPVDAFFDRVTVNAEDAELRCNRLRLLSRIGATLSGVADVSQIEAGS